jgi:hypothetical protein
MYTFWKLLLIIAVAKVCTFEPKIVSKIYGKGLKALSALTPLMPTICMVLLAMLKAWIGSLRLFFCGNLLHKKKIVSR